MSSARSIALLGASGLLGDALSRALGDRVAVRTYFSNPRGGGRRFDARSSAVADLFTDRPFAAIVLLGETRIDVCARDPAGTAATNVHGVIRVIRELSALGVLPVFTSSDGVFEGTRAWYTEEDEARPILTYGRQKLEVERFLASHDAPWLAVRLPKLLEPMLDGWMSALGEGRVIDCAIDQYFTPASAGDAARAIIALIDQEARGLLHVAGPERLSRRALLQAVVDEYRLHREPKGKIVECSLADIKVLEPRPLDTSLSSDRAVSRHAIRLRPASEIAKLAVKSAFGTKSQP